MKSLCTAILFWVSFVLNGKPDVPLAYQFVFGPSPQRVRHMKAANLFDASQQQIDLAEAAAKGDTNRMQSLIAQGADLNFEGHRGMRPLFWALINQNAAGFKFLLDQGADANALLNITKPPCDNALTLAVLLEDSSYVEELLKHGADPNVVVGRYSQHPPLFIASTYEYTNDIVVLLKYGAKIDWQRSETGNTLMQEAVHSGSCVMALFLYNAGADPLIKNRRGVSVVDDVKRAKDIEDIFSKADREACKKLMEIFQEKGLLNKLEMK